MLLVAAAVAGLLAGLATGGSIRPVLRLRLRWPLVAVVALAVRVLGVLEPLATSPLTPALFVASLLALIAWTLWNRDVLRGAWIIALGVAMNLAVVLANGGRMPVLPATSGTAPSALAKRGVWGQYVLARPDMHAVWLGDRLQLPAPLGRVFREVYSPGDLVVCLGLGVVFYLATRPSLGIPSQR